MKLSKTHLFCTALSAVISCSTLSASAQDAAPGGPGGGRGNFNPEEFRKRMDDRVKEALKVSDDEWAAIQPLLEKVQTKQREAMAAQFELVIRASFGNAGGGGERPRGAAEAEALRETLENAGSSPEEIKAKVAAVRDARKKNAAELDAAREDLRKVLTLRQEATLVTMGVLE